MPENKWSEYEKLILTLLDKLDNRMEKLEDRATSIEKCVSHIRAENKIMLWAIALLMTGLITLAFKVMA